MEKFKYIKEFQNFEYTSKEKLNENIEDRLKKYGEPGDDAKTVAKAFNKIFGPVAKQPAQKKWEEYFNPFGKIKKNLSAEETEAMKALINEANKAVEKGVKKFGLALSNDNAIGMKLTYDRKAGYATFTPESGA